MWVHKHAEQKTHAGMKKICLKFTRMMLNNAALMRVTLSVLHPALAKQHYGRL
jgi:hypothetical protein